eukprot:CAMPEP_0117757856 /NCGR_PEP_ID=MMETSP0947-20121206/15003_1 /TAXON_ID=44440 /ORGANISM="Chattonella subsalsa, Strain CCMP2191" /LENGTH=453 /DNA_ID=CAMNT_0005577875 /DNA_START=213 /DNA_END=1574 /DNA_ORIENTATION=-
MSAVATRFDPDTVAYDARLVASDPQGIKAHLEARRSSSELLDSVDKIGELDIVRRELIQVRDKSLNVRKTLSAEIGKLMKAGDTEGADEKKKEVEAANIASKDAEEKLSKIEEELTGLFARLPNLLDAQTPDGDDDTQNELISEFNTGSLKKGEEYLWHDEIAAKLGGFMPEAAAKISGARFSVLTGPVAKLERALMQFALDFHSEQNGYTECAVPYIVTRSTLEGTGQLPKFEEDLFKVNHEASGEDAFLIPTAEVPLTNLYRGEILEQKQLPVSFVALTPSFRAEAGSYGRDTRGLLRQHQFNKVELVKLCTAEQAKEEHEKLTQDAENCLQALKLPYRKVRLCSGDIGFGARMCYDLEVWLPGQEEFREIASCSNCADFQARRMNLRYRVVEGKKKKNVFAHTMNGSGLAVGRALVAVLENYYNPEDGSLTVPDVLRPYMGGVEKIEAVA